MSNTESKPSYSDRDPKGWGGDPRRGAAMGRGTWAGPADFSGRITLRRVHLDNGGYDTNGTYFGHGDPLYWYASDDGEIDGMLRAAPAYDTKKSRADARRQVLEMYPDAKVRR